MDHVRPISPAALRTELVAAIATLPGARRHIVVIDGASPAHPERLAAELVDPLRERGIPVIGVHAEDFLRPASIRLEYGHQDIEMRYSGWLDISGLRREVIDRFTPNGPAAVLPTLWDPVADRATRAGYVDVPEGAALIIEGNLLLHQRIPVDLSVHLALSTSTLRRALPADQQWTLPALHRYSEEAQPEKRADIVVRYDHPDRPAIGYNGQDHGD